MAYLDDYVQKLKRAVAVKSGLPYIHLFSPCPPGWRAPIDSAITISRMAVETNYFPLWEAENGQLRLTHEISHPKQIGELTRLIGRFSHLEEDDHKQFQELVNHRLDMIRSLSNLNQEC